MRTFPALILMVSALAATAARAQTYEQIRAVLYLTGAESEESLDEQEWERFSPLFSRPLEINLASRDRLVSSGLMTPYQAASLEDYKAHSGEVLSFAELAAIDGFGEEYVNAVRPLISLRYLRLAGDVHGPPKVSQDAILKGAVRNGGYNCGMKYRISYKDRAAACVAVRNTYSEKDPTCTFSAAWSGRRLPYKVVIGDFGTRFGQGLCLWSGFSLSGLSSAESFVRKPTGLSQSWAFSPTGTHRGVAGNISLGRFRLTAIGSFEGLRTRMESGKDEEIRFLPGGNVSWFGRNGQAGLTVAGDRKASADFRWTLRGADIFGEAACDLGNGSVAGVGGVIMPVGDWRIGAVARYYPEAFSAEYTGAVRSWSRTADEYGASMGTVWRGFVLSADFARRLSEDKTQWKFLLKAPFQIFGNMLLSLRVSERLRPYEVLKYRTDCRCDVDYSSSGISPVYGISDGPAWMGRIRLEWLQCRAAGLLGYLEAGRKTDSFSTYIRGTVFRIDNWDDRIYSYERDAPGNFNVPAYYGRGVSAAWTGGCRINLHERPWRSMRIYLRASMLSYFHSEKPSKWEGKLQLVFDL